MTTGQEFTVPEGWTLMNENDVPVGWEFSYLATPGVDTIRRRDIESINHPCVVLARRPPLTVRIPDHIVQAIAKAGTFAAAAAGTVPTEQFPVACWDELVGIIADAILNEEPPCSR